MKSLGNNLLLGFVVVLLASCSSSGECDKINRRNLAGIWQVQESASEGSSIQSSTQKVDFDSDGSYQDDLFIGTWEFGEFKNEIIVTTDVSQTVYINIIEFSKKEMIFEQDVSGEITEYNLSKQD